MQQRLEQYLDSLEKPLSRLPAEERREWREEAAQHLACLVTAHEELGAAQEEAITAALAQFGDAQTIARRMRQEAAYRKVALSPAQAAAGALCLLIITTTIVASMMGLVAALYVQEWGPSSFLSHLLLASLAVSAPLISGFLLGSSVPRWHISRHLPAQRLTSRFLPVIALQLWILLALNAVMGLFVWPSGNGAAVNFAFNLLCLPLTVVGVGAGSCWKRARLRRRRRAL